MQNKIKILLFIIFYYQNVSCQPTSKMNNSVDLADSLSVETFINSRSLCDKLSYIERNKSAFVNFEGYSMRIISSVSKQAKKSFFLPIANGGVLQEEESKKEFLEEQIDEIKIACGCRR